MKQIVPPIQDLKRRSMHQPGGETTMSPSLIVLREDRVLAVVTAPRLQAVLSVAPTLAIGLSPQMLAFAAQVNLPDGEGIAYTTFTSDKEASLAVQRYEVRDDQVVFSAPERGRPDDRTIMDELAKAMSHAPLDPAKVARKEPGAPPSESPETPDFIPVDEGRMAIDAGTVKATFEQVKGIGGTALFIAANPTHATKMLAAGLPPECLLAP